jgi:hypothetical protein
MRNTINGKKPTFGDPEQIAWLKRQARLKEAVEHGYVTADLEDNPLKARLLKDQVVLVRFVCPGCLEHHQFSPSLMDESVYYTAPCRVEFQYDVAEEHLQLTTSSDKSVEK